MEIEFALDFHEWKLAKIQRTIFLFMFLNRITESKCPRPSPIASVTNISEKKRYKNIECNLTTNKMRRRDYFSEREDMKECNVTRNKMRRRGWQHRIFFSSTRSFILFLLLASGKLFPTLSRGRSAPYPSGLPARCFWKTGSQAYQKSINYY